MTLIIMRGISGSGKSTEARKIQAEFPGSIVVSRDDIRLSMYNKLWGPPINEDMVTTIEHFAIMTALFHSRQQIVISDNTNLMPENVSRVIKIACDSDHAVEVFQLDVPIERAIAQNNRRPTPVPEHVIRRQFDALQKHKLVKIGVEGKEVPLPTMFVRPEEKN